MTSSAPIGIFDSGIGGLTVVKEVRRLLPQENIIYFGDTARAPYGSRPPAQIVTFMHQILDFFADQNIKLAVFACNTMTALGLEEARAKYPFPLVGMNTGVRQALRCSGGGRIGVLATQATIASDVHRKAVEAAAARAVIYSQACPKFVPLIEQGIIAGAQLEEAVREYLEPMNVAGIDTLILGCTHYPFIAETLRGVVGPAVRIVDPARDTAVAAREVLLQAGGLADLRQSASVRLCFSAGLDKARQMAGLVMDTAGAEFSLVELAIPC